MTKTLQSPFFISVSLTFTSYLFTQHHCVAELQTERLQVLTYGRHGGGQSADKGLQLQLLILTFCRRFCGRVRYTANGHLQQILVRFLHRCLAISCQNFSLPPPFDEGHTISDGLPNNLYVAFQEKT